MSPCCSRTRRPGAHSPALVSQGKIAQVISARPTERGRCWRKPPASPGSMSAERMPKPSCAATEANLVRLDELLADMEHRAAALRRQAKAAERYRRLSEGHRVAEEAV
jgi:chromosome segregation protein